MVKFTLILLYADSEETLELIRRSLSDVGLYLSPMTIITWKDRQEIEKRLSKAKSQLMDALDKGYKGEFSYAIIELNEDQYRSIRQMIVTRLIKEDETMITRGEALLRRMRSTKHINKIRNEVNSFINRYKWVIQLHEVFDVRHDLLTKMMDLSREIMNEINDA